MPGWCDIWQARHLRLRHVRSMLLIRRFRSNIFYNHEGFIRSE
jgi:hypothetical protein